MPKTPPAVGGIPRSSQTPPVPREGFLAPSPDPPTPGEVSRGSRRERESHGPKKGQAKVRVVVNKGPEDVESHSPTVQMATLRALLALMAAKRAKGAAGDFPQAYLNVNQ